MLPDLGLVFTINLTSGVFKPSKAFKPKIIAEQQYKKLNAQLKVPIAIEEVDARGQLQEKQYKKLNAQLAEW